MSILNEFDVNNVCRTCLISENLTPLYDYNNKDTQYIDKILMMCTLIKCYKNDGLPNQICSDCITEIKRSHKFALKCQQSQNKLQNYLNNEKYKSHTSLEDPLKIPESQNVFVQELVLIKSELDDQLGSSEVKNELVVIKNECDIDEIKLEYNNDTEEMEEEQHCREMPTLIDSKAVFTGETPYSCATNGVCTLNQSDEKAYSCTVCKTHESKLEYLKKPYSCAICRRSYSDLTALNYHFYHHRGKKTVNRFLCSVCNATFKYGANLQAHLRSHTGEKPYSFSQSSATGKKPYSCTFCDKTFNRIAACTDHINLHKYLMTNPEKPFLCTVCNGSFTVKANLIRHMQTHTEKKRFKCSVCSVSFSRLQQIQNHLLTHVDDTPYSQIYIKRIRKEES